MDDEDQWSLWTGLAFVAGVILILGIATGAFYEIGVAIFGG